MRADAPLTWPGTTPGAVYVTLSVAAAADYARLALINEGRQDGGSPPARRSWYACVFAITLSPGLLLPDSDDQEYEANWAPGPDARLRVASRRVLGGIDIDVAGSVRWAIINAASQAQSADPALWPWSPARADKYGPPFLPSGRQ